MKKFKQFSEEMTFKVEVDGLPSMYIDGNSPGQVKNHLRTLIKQPSLIKSVKRQTKHDVKKTYRAKSQGKDVDENLELETNAKDNAYAIGMSQAMKSTGDKPPLKKSTITKAHKIAKAINKNESVELPYHELSEGINDPAIFKAVFLAGGPGSGKSFIVGQTALTALGLKLINSDDAFEAGLAKAGLQTKPEDIYSPLGQKTREKAVALTKKKMELAIKGRLGLVIDGTGKNYEKIKKQVSLLKSLGYDTAMIFVNTDLDTALERNKKRARTLPDSEVETMWKDVQKNIGKFQSMFRQKMYIVDNSDGSNYKGAVLSTYKKIATWTKEKPNTKAAKVWIELEKEKRNIKESLNERTSIRPTIKHKRLKNLRIPNPNYKELLNRKKKEKRDMYREIKSADVKKEDNVNEKLTGKDSKGHFRATEKGAGMTQKGVDAVNRKTGGNLQTAVTGKVKPGSKAAGRRKSYCARSAGQMKMFPKAAADPNSRLRQARKRWKC